MKDQILMVNKLNKWFWLYGVFPLLTSYMLCLNFAVEYFLIQVEFKPSITKYYMGELLGFTTLGLACIMILWCNIIAIRVHGISSNISIPNFKVRKFIFNISVIIIPVTAFIAFIPLVRVLFNNSLYFPLFPLIEPIAKDLTPFLFPVYLFLLLALNTSLEHFLIFITNLKTVFCHELTLFYA